MKLTAGCPQDKHFLLNCSTHAAFSPPQSPHTPAKFLLALLIPLFKKKMLFCFILRCLQILWLVDFPYCNGLFDWSLSDLIFIWQFHMARSWIRFALSIWDSVIPVQITNCTLQILWTLLFMNLGIQAVLWKSSLLQHKKELFWFFWIKKFFSGILSGDSFLDSWAGNFPYSSVWRL